MTLPNITIGSINGGYYSEFTPEGMVDRVRLYGSTREEVEEKAFTFLEEHDRKLRAKAAEASATAQPYIDRLMGDWVKPSLAHLGIRSDDPNLAEDPGSPVAEWEAKHPLEDAVNHPAHYTRFNVEVIELTENLNFCRGNAVKYLCRAGVKNAATELEDLEKARWYVEREIDRVRRGES
jgi:hypothetical protein